jgi:DNA-3-methyladenine glycosylase II
MNFYYDEEAIRYLKAKDPILADIIDRIGPIERPIDADLFSALVNNIVGQQISMKAQETVWKRMLGAFGAITPENLCRASVEEIQQCGLSTRKAIYIREAAEKVLSGECNLEALKGMSDEAVIAELSQLRGIGKWTAEMLLIFSMGRQDVLSWDDLAIHRGLRMVYHHRKITKQLFQKYKRRYAPYGSIASLYLWEVSVGVLPDLKDYAPLTDAEKKKRLKQRQELKRAEKPLL